MLNRFIAHILIFCFTINTFAATGEKTPSASEVGNIITSLSPEFLKAELVSLKEKHQNIRSWKELKNLIESFRDEDKSFLLARINEWEKNPFQKPTFTATGVGFDLNEGEDKIRFNLQEGNLNFRGKVLPLQGQTLKNVHRWLSDSPTTTSLMSLFVNDAHALAPLAIGLIAFAITSIGILWNSSCREAFAKTESRINDLWGTCNWDYEQNRSSPEIRELLREISSTENNLIRSRRQTCDQQIRDSHKWLFFLSCSENTSAICNKIDRLSRCLTAIRNRGPINDSNLWREGPRQPGRAAPVRPGAQSR